MCVLSKDRRVILFSYAAQSLDTMLHYLRPKKTKKNTEALLKGHISNRYHEPSEGFGSVLSIVMLNE